MRIEGRKMKDWAKNENEVKRKERGLEEDDE